MRLLLATLVARDQHLLACPYEAGTLLPQRHHAADRPDGDRLLSRHRHLHGRLPRVADEIGAEVVVPLAPARRPAGRWTATPTRRSAA